ncbi:MAG: helix-turn-helix domain-containing protein [bacterium]
MFQQISALKKFEIHQNEPNFIIGISGNAITATIQNEYYLIANPAISYFTYSEFEDASERGILTELLQTIFYKYTEKEITQKQFSKARTNLDLFKVFIQLLSKADFKRTEQLVVIDQIELILTFSNVFFFTLSKLFTLNKIIPELKITTVIIADYYLNPAEEKYPRGLESFFYNNTNFNIIPTFSFEALQESSYHPFKYSLQINQRIFQLSGGNPALVAAITAFYDKNSTLESTALLTDYNIEWKLNEIWETLTPSIQELLEALILKKHFNIVNLLQKNFLIQTGLLNSSLTKFKMLILEEFIKTKIAFHFQELPSYLKIQNKYLYLKDLPPQLEKLLVFLEQKSNALVSRDEIATLLWGTEANIKYSNYAIDKNISDLRKLLQKLLATNAMIIETKKGRGYLLKN